MERNTRPKKGLLYIMETEDELRQAIAGDVQQEIENRKREMEDDLVALTDALRSLN